MELLKTMKLRVRHAMLSPTARRHSRVGQASIWKVQRAFQYSFLRDQGLAPSNRLLDLGCGTLRGGIPLIRFLDTGNYWGLDIRPDVVDVACRELRSNHLEHKRPHLVTAYADIDPDTLFEVAFAFEVLIHMNDDVLSQALEFVRNHLSENGRFFANVNVGNFKSGHWQGFPVLFKPLSFYEDQGRAGGFDVEDLGSLRELGHDSGRETRDAQRMLSFVPR